MTALPWWTAPDRDCTCRHEVASLGRLHGVDMGRGRVRIGTTPGCPSHDTCLGFTKAMRAQYRNGPMLCCPKHPRYGATCPDAEPAPSR